MTSAPAPDSGPTFAIRGPLSRNDLPGLCERVCDVLTGCAGSRVTCNVRSVPSDAVTIEALALLQLAARRQGCQVLLRNASDELIGLVDFLGLSEVLPEESAPLKRPSAAAD